MGNETRRRQSARGTRRPANPDHRPSRSAPPTGIASRPDGPLTKFRAVARECHVTSVAVEETLFWGFNPFLSCDPRIRARFKAGPVPLSLVDARSPLHPRRPGRRPSRSPSGHTSFGNLVLPVEGRRSPRKTSTTRRASQVSWHQPGSRADTTQVAPGHRTCSMGRRIRPPGPDGSIPSGREATPLEWEWSVTGWNVPGRMAWRLRPRRGQRPPRDRAGSLGPARSGRSGRVR